jgi:SAM-dependent methyltransferase
MLTLEYGASAHYQGEEGRAYFAFQSRHSCMAGLVARKFAPHIAPHHTVIDFGCGGGFTLSVLACRRKIGIELNPVARETARRNGIECFADISELPDGVADVAIINHALEHVPYPIRVLELLRRKLAADGKVLLSVPLDDWRSQRRFREDDMHRHLHTWTPQLLGNTLLQAGYPVQSGDIRILRHAIHPLAVPVLYRLPRAASDAVTFFTAVAMRRRELFAVIPKCRP